MSDAAGHLQRLGFGEYEARAYLALLQRSPLNGYEVAKASGLPRANVYAVLQKLEERGAVMRLDTPAGARYTPVAPAELTRRLESNFQESLQAASQALESVAEASEYEYVWNARGYPALLEHARTVVDEAESQLLVAQWPEEAAALADDLRRAEERGVAVTTLCLSDCRQDCGGCRGRVYRYRMVPEQPGRWLVLAGDGAQMLAGEIGPDGDSLVVRTRQRLLVELAGWYIRSSAALAAVLSDLGDKLVDELRSETRAMLAAVGPTGQSQGWMTRVRRLLGVPGDERPSRPA